MKKYVALLIGLLMVILLVGCGDSTKDQFEDQIEDAADAIEESADDIVDDMFDEDEDYDGDEYVEESSGVVEEGATGVGEEILSTEFFDLTVPEDIQYEVYFYSVDPDTNSGTINIDMGEYSTLEMRLEATTTRMAASMDEAVEECIRTKNLDTYDNGSSEELESVNFNGTEYRVVKIITDYSETIHLVTYYQSTFDGADMYVEIELDGVDLDTEYVKETLDELVFR